MPNAPSKVGMVSPFVEAHECCDDTQGDPFSCFSKLFWVDIVWMLGIVKTPPTKEWVFSGDECWSGYVPIIFSAAPIEGCPIVFSFYFDEFYYIVFLVWFVNILSSTEIECSSCS